MSQELPVGFHRFTKRNFINYQLNRWYSEGYTRLDEIEEAGRLIDDVDDCKSVFTGFAERARAEGRLRNAAFYYRAAEFLTDPEDPDKVPLYRKFNETFYQGFADEGIERFSVPYGGAFIPAMRLSSARSPSKGVVLIHGGFDSFIEEFFCYWRHFADSGYDVIAFEGPGQGAALRLYGLYHTHDWEKPVAAILDFFSIEECTILGISFGGYWCLRAAAFEKRIKRVIAHSVLYELLEGASPLVRALVPSVMRARNFMNRNIRSRMRLIPTIRHVVRHCLSITGPMDREPIEVASWLLAMNKEHLHSELIDQDVLLLAGERDRFQPPALYRKQMAALTAARSVTGRIFTREEQAANHCQMGNLGLALRYMTEWLDRLSSAEG